MSGGGSGAKKPPGGGAMATYFRQTKDLGNALVMSVPLLVLYSVGLFITGGHVANGADFITNSLYGALGSSGYLIFQTALLAMSVGAAIVLRAHGRFHLPHYPLLLGESLAYALSMGTVIIVLIEKAHLVGPLDGKQGVIGSIVLAAGAGFHEELVFRLLMLSGLALFLTRLAPKKKVLMTGVALVVTSVLFSLAHYIGPPTFAWYTFWYRVLAGIFFALLYVFRGFAVAAYSHFLYDVYVMVF